VATGWVGRLNQGPGGK